MVETNNDLERLSGKLDVIISLLSDMKDLLGEKCSTKQKVAYFVERGLGNKDIAKILGISEKHVSKEKTIMNSNKKIKGETENGREKTI